MLGKASMPLNPSMLAYSHEQRKIQRHEQFSQPQLLRTYSFCFGSDEIIHQVSNDGQARSAYFKDFQKYVYKPLVVADENTNTQQKKAQSLEQCAQLQLLRASSHHFELSYILYQNENLSQGKCIYYFRFLCTLTGITPASAGKLI